MNKTMCGTKTRRHFLLPIAALMLAGCGDGVYALPENAPELEQVTYVNEKDKEYTYNTIIMNGRKYAAYGTMTGNFHDREVETCVGYTDGDKKQRVCTLKATGDYIMQTRLDGCVEQPLFYRATDTLGKYIYTPRYIASLDYDLWNGENAKEGDS